MWLSVMIARQCSKLSEMFEAIQAIKILGSINSDLLEKFKDSYVSKEFSCDPHAMSGTSPNYFGFWLSRGPGTNKDEYGDKIHEAVGLFNKIEFYYMTYFKISDDELILEAQQDGVFRTNPRREPRLKHSGHWRPGPLTSPLPSPVSEPIQNIMAAFGSG